MPTWKALLVANSRCIIIAENFNYRLHILILVKGGVVLSNYCFRFDGMPTSAILHRMWILVIADLTVYTKQNYDSCVDMQNRISDEQCLFCYLMQ